jgi:CubicO group peptidase (beta-lactamase class C family)
MVSLALLETAFFLAGLIPARAQASPTSNHADADARSFLDKLVTDRMAADEVLGVSVVVIKDGQPWYEHGYGFADEKKTRPVDPQTTEFFAASISKLFVATAVMQLAQQGRLDLHRDINHYLDFRLTPFHDSRPITLDDLLTHTAGVDDHMVGAESPIGQPVDLGDYFRQQVPPLVREPGSEINYSNHGVALAGHVVERASGMTFYKYAERRILAPLGMQHSTFRQPLPDSFRNNLGFERFEEPYTIPYPVATLVTTPADMGTFMLAHLRAAPSGTRILTDDALDAMQAQHFAPSPELPGVAYGFFEAWDAGGRGLFHAGARDHFSLLYLVPERGFGIYIVMCGASEASQLPSQVVHTFLQHLFGPANPRTPGTSGTSLAAIPGWLPGRYRLDAISHTTLEKLVGLRAEMRVRPAGDDIDVTIPSFSRGEYTERYLQVVPLQFRAPSGAVMLFRRVAPIGGAKAFRSDFVSDPMSFTRLHWFESATVFLVTIAFSYAVFAVFLVLAIYWLIRKRTVSDQRWVWNVGALLSLCALTAPAIGIGMAVAAKEHQLYTIERILRVVMLIFHPAIVLAVVVLALTPSVLVKNRWPLGRQIAFGNLGFASLLFLRFVFYWQVWGWHF